jgi:cytochrome b
MRTVRVWDLPTRLFHWLLVACVIGLVVTANLGGGWMEWHLRLGYTVLTLLLFRLGWGFVGGHWSRFGSFVRGPAAIARYLKGQATPLETIGHNPLGALSVLAMLLALALQVSAGLFTDDEIAYAGPLIGVGSGETVALASWYHTGPGKLVVLALVVLHIAAIAWYARVRKQRLLPAMIHGDREVDMAGDVPVSADGVRQRLLALVLLAVCAGLTWALVRWGYVHQGY